MPTLSATATWQLLHNYLSIYLVFASTASILQLQLQSNSFLFVCLPQQSFINVDNAHTSSIKITVTMTIFHPSATVTQTNNRNGNCNILTNVQLWPKQPAALPNETQDHDERDQQASRTPSSSILTIHQHRHVSKWREGRYMHAIQRWEGRGVERCCWLDQQQQHHVRHPQQQQDHVGRHPHQAWPFNNTEVWIMERGHVQTQWFLLC